MPIAISPAPPNSAGVLTPTGAISMQTIPVGAAVRLLTESGEKHLYLCGATASGEAPGFVGFAAHAISIGSGGTLITGRGSIITPVVTGSIPLVPGQMVFLSMTLGQVTQSPDSSTTGYVLRVGYAISTTEMTLNTDMISRNP